jgi:DNA-binding MarR family transcriptional regulator
MNTAELSSSLRSAVSALHKGLRKQAFSVNTYSMTEMETIGHLSRSAALLPTELAALARVKTQSMSQILKKMEAQGVIRRKPSRDDKRKVFISLTPFGKKLVEKAKYDKDEWLKDAIDRSLSEKEKELLVRVLPVLNKLTETKQTNI